MKRIVTLAAFLFLLCGCSKQPPPSALAPAPEPGAAGEKARLVVLDEAALKEASVKSELVSERTVPLTIRSNGRLTTNENTTWRVGAVTEGRIVLAVARVGDRVEKGQVLARMHSHDIHESRAAYRKAVADVNRLTGNVEFARRTRDRLRRLYEMKAASFEQVDQADNELRNAQNALANAEVEVQRTRLHLVEYLQIPIEGPPDHGDSPDPDEHPEHLVPIRAPASGVVLTRAITPGAVVGVSTDLYTICDLSTIWAIAAVQEENLAQLRPGMAARVYVQAYPDRPFHGKVIKIEEKLDQETRTVPVRVEVPNAQGLLKPEMYATVELDAGSSERALFVSQAAIQDVNGQATLFVEKERGRYEPRPVETGPGVHGLVRVARGLKAGERVVTEGSFILKSQQLKSTLQEE